MKYFKIFEIFSLHISVWCKVTSGLCFPVLKVEPWRCTCKVNTPPPSFFPRPVFPDGVSLSAQPGLRHLTPLLSLLSAGLQVWGTMPRLMLGFEQNVRWLNSANWPIYHLEYLTFLWEEYWGLFFFFLVTLDFLAPGAGKVKAPAARPMRADSCKLSLDLHIHSLAHACMP